MSAWQQWDSFSTFTELFWHDTNNSDVLYDNSSMKIMVRFIRLKPHPNFCFFTQAISSGCTKTASGWKNCSNLKCTVTIYDAVHASRSLQYSSVHSNGVCEPGADEVVKDMSLRSYELYVCCVPPRTCMAERIWPIWSNSKKLFVHFHRVTAAEILYTIITR
jgi:hypothetical protein